MAKQPVLRFTTSDGDEFFYKVGVFETPDNIASLSKGAIITALPSDTFSTFEPYRAKEIYLNDTIRVFLTYQKNTYYTSAMVQESIQLSGNISGTTTIGMLGRKPPNSWQRPNYPTHSAGGVSEELFYCANYGGKEVFAFNVPMNSGVASGGIATFAFSNGFVPYGNTSIATFASVQGTNRWVIPATTDFRYPFIAQYLKNINDNDWVELYPGIDSESGGGDGDFDKESDSVDSDFLPTENVIVSKLVNLYELNQTQVQNLSAYLWSDDFLTNLPKLFNDPMQAILSLKMIKVDPTSTTASIKVGNLDSGVSAGAISNQFLSLDCGTIELSEYYGNALDYSPYTQVSIYLPYIGIRQLDVDEVMGATLNVKYKIDLLTGCCVCDLKVSKNIGDTELNSVLYNFAGVCAFDVPLSASNMAERTSAILQAVGGFTVNALSGNVAGTAESLLSGAVNVMTSKATVQHGSGLDGNSGLLCNQKPYLIIKRPIQSIAKTFAQQKGFPSNITAKLSTLNGFTSVSHVRVTIQCLDEERTMIENLLKSGVIL